MKERRKLNRTLTEVLLVRLFQEMENVLHAIVVEVPEYSFCPFHALFRLLIPFLQVFPFFIIGSCFGFFIPGVLQVFSLFNVWRCFDLKTLLSCLNFAYFAYFYTFNTRFTYPDSMLLRERTIHD